MILPFFLLENNFFATFKLSQEKPLSVPQLPVTQTPMGKTSTETISSVELLSRV